MTRGKANISWIENQKARYKKRNQTLMKDAKELTILCNMVACLVFYSPDDKQVVTWPSHKEAKSLFERYFSLPPYVRNVTAMDQKSFLNNKIEKIEKELADTRKVNTVYVMDNLMFQLEKGRSHSDLSTIEANNLIAYSKTKIVNLEREIRCRKNYNPTSVNEPSPRRGEIMMPLNVDAELVGISFNARGSETVYYMDGSLGDHTKVSRRVKRTCMLVQIMPNETVEEANCMCFLIVIVVFLI